jgi:hypothetical protein
MVHRVRPITRGEQTTSSALTLASHHPFFAGQRLSLVAWFKGEMSPPFLKAAKAHYTALIRNKPFSSGEGEVSAGSGTMSAGSGTMSAGAGSGTMSAGSGTIPLAARLHRHLGWALTNLGQVCTAGGRA